MADVVTDPLADLDFDIAIPCSCEGFHPEHGTGDAVWEVTLGCPMGCEHMHQTACAGCWEFYLTTPTKYACGVCHYVGPAHDFALDWKPIKRHDHG